MDPVHSKKAPRVHVLPTTPRGWWALRLGSGWLIAPVVAPLAAIDPIRYLAWGLGAAAFIAGTVGGVLAVSAIIRDRERALMVLFVAGLLVLLVVFTVLEASVTGSAIPHPSGGSICDVRPT